MMNCRLEAILGIFLNGVVNGVGWAIGVVLLFWLFKILAILQ